MGHAGPDVGQVALRFGADDFGIVMFEENVVSSAGTTFCIDADAIEGRIRAAGFRSVRRNVRYDWLDRAGMTVRIVHADAIVPGEERPLPDGAVVVDEGGTVARRRAEPARSCRGTRALRSSAFAASSCPGSSTRTRTSSSRRCAARSPGATGSSRGSSA